MFTVCLSLPGTVTKAKLETETTEAKQADRLLADTEAATEEAQLLDEKEKKNLPQLMTSYSRSKRRLKRPLWLF
jgi:hypothetical protein